MKNVFAPKNQIEDYDAKLIAGIERLSTVFKSVLQETAKGFKLTPLQTQLLIFIDEHAPNLCTVTSLSEEFSVTKATISDSLKVLSKKGLVEKVHSASDARTFHFRVSKSAEAMVKKLNIFGAKMAKMISPIELEKKKELSYLTLKMLNIFQKENLIPGRMCYSCRYFQEKFDGQFCRLLKSRLCDDTIRLDCPEHEAKT